MEHKLINYQNVYLAEKHHRGRKNRSELIMNLLFAKVTLQLHPEAEGTALQQL